MKRVLHEPAFVLHRYDWSETSLILEVFTRHHGRIALVAKGAKRPSSNFRPVLLPLQPLNVAYSGDAEVGTLKGAEWSGGLAMPSGDALLSGYYINELLMRLLARDDPHEALFDAYTACVQLLNDPDLPAALRAFELMLLREIGLLPVLDSSSHTLTTLSDNVEYFLVAESGLRERGEQDPAGLLAGSWRALQTVLDDAAPFTSIRAVCSGLGGAEKNALKLQLRSLLHYHCGTQTLRTRQLMMDIQSL